jgi:hypothetical protein
LPVKSFFVGFQRNMSKKIDIFRNYCQIMKRKMVE